MSTEAELQQRIAELEALVEARALEVQQQAARIQQLELRQKKVNDESTLLRTLIDSLPDYIYIKDLDGRLILNNTAHLNFMQVASFDEVAGKTDLELFPSELAEEFFAEEQAIMRLEKELLNREEPIIDGTGRQRWLSTTKIPFRNQEGEIVGLVGVSRDITERKLAEQEREQLQQQLIEAQREAMQELSTPIIPIFDRIIVMPLIGSIDTARARDIMRALLAGITQYRAQIVILDITGVPLVDSGVAEHLDKTIQAVRLKGARTIITGISDAVAETIVDLGIDWSRFQTLRDLQSGLIVALNQLGVHIELGASKSSK